MTTSSRLKAAPVLPPMSAKTKAASPARDEATQNIQYPATYPANLSDNQDCPKWHKCSAPICPLDAEWSHRKHIKGERACFYLVEMAKVPLESILRGSTAIGLAEKVTRTIPNIIVRCAPLKKAFDRAKNSGSRMRSIGMRL